ncbi:MULTISPECIES: toxin-antitoxin system YwqK family antitoxin [Aliiglaciecola]|uniref:toxin-antitoxin system YwqK family antitoxin n=1 Tax=Aliiglaciecola TaxID=1406885 RepID=UPI0026E16DD8|nr:MULTISPECIES: toxin-antitoxin system YwqK family antitoxin [unclassified Aliiglaciecola]MDO6711680.1 toxin-antitoxin system YwqK family antitoxin [Aliiglaciecola sp. 2_MG-2023]MDO6752751.1 toxin-antitoxin system YwqK family antitoxin [Aliiglaciecola sp. 1_MG-2023]
MISTDKQRFFCLGLRSICVLAVLMVGAITAATTLAPVTPLVIEKSEISINSQGQRVYQDEPFNGDMVSYHPSGSIATSDQFVNGRRQGHARKWFENGTLGYESHYVSGKRDGDTKTWWINGNPRSHFVYVNGKAEGTAWRWYRNGAKFKKFNYLAGKPIGLQQAWRLNGKLFSNFEYKNGRIYGLRKANNCVGVEDEVVSPDYYQNQANNSL